jgi:hypothetical protein
MVVLSSLRVAAPTRPGVLSVDEDIHRRGDSGSGPPVASDRSAVDPDHPLARSTGLRGEILRDLAGGLPPVLTDPRGIRARRIPDADRSRGTLALREPSPEIVRS